MITSKKLLLFPLLPLTILLFTQSQTPIKTITKTSPYVFRDTIFNFVFDSISNNLGNIAPSNENNRMVKHFKYIGKEPISITRTWTGDPHFICEYPNEPLRPGGIYSFTICFWHQGKQGRMEKTMGFDLSDGSTISFKFTGTYLPITTGK